MTRKRILSIAAGLVALLLAADAISGPGNSPFGSYVARTIVGLVDDVSTVLCTEGQACIWRFNTHGAGLVQLVDASGAYVDASGGGGGSGGTVSISQTGTENDTDTNIAKVNTATVDIGNGSPGAGTQRVAVATGSSITLATGSNVVGAVTQSGGPWTGNTTQLGGTSIATNTGTATGGTQRVVLATDQPALTTPMPVTGTVAATQFGEWTMQPGNTPNTIPWLVDSSGQTQTVTGTVALSAGTADTGRTLCGKADIITREVTILDADNAQTNASLVGTIASGTCIELYGIDAMASLANTGTSGISVRVGFGASAVPTAALAGVNGVALSHLGIAPGSGVSKGNGCSLLSVGASGEELRATVADPVGGGITLTFQYRIISC